MAKGRKGAQEKPPPGRGLGRRLAVLRTALNLTQSQVARLANMRRSSVTNYEADIVTPEASTLEHLLKTMGFRWRALDLTQEYLDRLSSECSLPTGLLSPEQATSQDVLDPEEDRQEASALWQEYKSLSRELRQQKLQEAPAHTCWALCELLCLESQDACRHELAFADELLDLALKLADRVTGSDPWRAKLRAFVWLHVANLLRVRGNFTESERAFIFAEHLWEAGREARTDLLEEGLRFALPASLCRKQRRFEEAAALLSQAASSARSEGLRVQVLVSKAKLLEDTGDLESAVATLWEAHEVALVANEQGKLFYIEHNLSDVLSKLERFEEAQTFLPAVQRRSRQAGGIDRVRAMWTAGRIAAGLGQVEEGIGLLVQVRGEFASRHMDYDTALVTLELSTIYAAQGRTSDVKALARHLVPIFQGKDMHKEALAALALFRQAAERETATAELSRGVLEFLRKARHDPTLRFQAS